MLSLVSDFFSMQDDTGKLKNASGHVDCKHPFKGQIAAADKPKSNDAVTLMLKYKQQLENQVKDMDAKILAKQKEVQAAFSQPDMQKNPYHLHSICVHEGGAESGHYYAYIYDRFNK